MPRKGKRSQAQKICWRKLTWEDLEDEQTRLSRINEVEQASTSADVAQFSDRTYAEGGDSAPRVLSVQASHCQNDARYDKFSRNHQCTCVALTFLANHSEGIQFKMPDLDRVLEEGDALYVGIKMQIIAEKRFHQNHLTMEEVPLSVSTFDQTLIVRKSDVRNGYLRARGTPDMEGWWIPLTERLQCLNGCKPCTAHCCSRVYCCFQRQIWKCVTSGYDSQSKELVNRTNNTIKSALLKYCNAEQNDWDQHQKIMYAINTSAQGSKKVTSFSVMFNRHPLIPESLDAAQAEIIIDNPELGTETKIAEVLPVHANVRECFISTTPDRNRRTDQYRWTSTIKDGTFPPGCGSHSFTTSHTNICGGTARWTSLDRYVEEFVKLAYLTDWSDAHLIALFLDGLDKDTIRFYEPDDYVSLTDTINFILYLNVSKFFVQEVQDVKCSSRPVLPKTRAAWPVCQAPSSSSYPSSEFPSCVTLGSHTSAGSRRQRRRKRKTAELSTVPAEFSPASSEPLPISAEPTPIPEGILIVYEGMDWTPLQTTANVTDPLSPELQFP